MKRFKSLDRVVFLLPPSFHCINTNKTPLKLTSNKAIAGVNLNFRFF